MCFEQLVWELQILEQSAVRRVDNTVMPLMLPFNREVAMAALTSVLMVERRSCNHGISSCYWDQAVLNDQLGIVNFINWREVLRTLDKELAFDNKV